MRTKLILLLVPVVAIACGGNSDQVRRDQQQYEKVEEGAASGTAASLGAVAPMTGTNADTTTAFTIDPALAATAPGAPPGTVAGSLPNQPYGGVGAPGYVPPPMTSGSAPQPVQSQPRIVTGRPPVEPATQREQPPPPPEQAEPLETPAPTDTAIVPPPPPAQTQTTAPPPPAEKAKEPAPPPPPQDESEEPQEEPAEEPPPPPPAAD